MQVKLMILDGADEEGTIDVGMMCKGKLNMAVHRQEKVSACLLKLGY
jgi:hypothetical protein